MRTPLQKRFCVNWVVSSIAFAIPVMAQVPDVQQGLGEQLPGGTQRNSPIKEIYLNNMLGSDKYDGLSL